LLRDEFNDKIKNIKRDGIDHLVEYLETKTDYFTAPASTIHHLNEAEGLLQHSLNVCNELQGLTHTQGLTWKDESSPIIIGLFHDLCKTNFYNPVEKFRKDSDGKWEKYLGYEVKDRFPLGHAEKSIILLQAFLKLTPEEILCIRWHMGAYESKECWNTMRSAFESNVNIYWTHVADMLASLKESTK
jgi:hypothetical protein